MCADRYSIVMSKDQRCAESRLNFKAASRRSIARAIKFYSTCYSTGEGQASPSEIDPTEYQETRLREEHRSMSNRNRLKLYGLTSPATAFAVLSGLTEGDWFRS